MQTKSTYEELKLPSEQFHSLIELNNSLKQQLEIYNLRFKALSEERSNLERMERKKIAEMLHDHLQPLMVGAKINMELLTKNIDSTMKPVAVRILDLINQMIMESRTLSADLTSPIVNSNNFSASLESLARWIYKNQNFEVKIEAKSELGVVRPDLMMVLYQSIRELLLNAVKHSGAKTVTIKIEDRDGEVEIITSDQGIGFDSDTVWQNGSLGKRFGLNNVRKNLVKHGGRLEINSKIGQGTSISLIIPKDKIIEETK